MAEIPIVIDTNLWSDLRLILTRLKERTDKSYKEIWDAFSDDFLKDKLSSEEHETFRGVINSMKRLIEMKESSTKYVLYVPSFVYNEAGRSVSSKIGSPAQGDEQYLQIFKDILGSLPIEAKVDDTVLTEGIDYPKKSTKKTGKIIETTMKDFLKNNKQETLKKLVDHLRNADDATKTEVQKRTQVIKNRMTDVLHKYQKWDQPMSEASKVLDFSYETRTKALSSLYGSVNKYRDVHKIRFKPDPLDVLAERLTMIDEEFDFFDLQIYLYAEEKGAHIITKNTQAYQEINDPCFLGYFEDVKVMHPLINFDTLADMNESADLNDIIDRSIKKDFKEVDLPICKELDKKLSDPILESKGGDLIKTAESSYVPETKRLKIDMALGNVLKVLRIENGKLKVSREFFFEEYNKVNILKFIDQNLFNNQLKSENFLKENVVIDKTRKYFLKSKVLSKFFETKENKGVKEKLELLKSKPDSYLDDFLKMYRGQPDKEVRNLFLALSIESQFSAAEIEEGLKDSSNWEPLPLSSCPPSKGMRKREASKCLLKWEQIEEFNQEKVHKRDSQKVKIDSQKFIEYIKTIKDPQERMQLIDFADQVLNSAEDHTSKISGSKVPEVTHLINNRKVLNYFSKVHSVSSALNYGMFAKSLLGDILNGNIEGVAVNIGFMAGNYGLSRIAAASLAKGVEFTKAGKVMLGNSLKFASPFISRFLSPLIALDLYHQIQALKAGDKDAIVGIVGDSIFLIIDAVDIGVSLLEIAGVVAELSAVTGPIGMVIGAVVLIGTDIYFAVRKVQKLDDIIHLTTGERWEIGAATFFTFGLVKFDVERLAQVKSANNQLAKQALEAIRKSPDIQRIVIPSAYWKGDNDIQIVQDNIFIPSYVDPNIKWARVRPDDPEGGKIFCAPEGNWENPPSGVMGKCQDAIGVADLETKTKNYTLFNLGDGKDAIQGFNHSPNIFRIGKGKKTFIGGDKNDVFIFEEGTSFNDFPEVAADGKGGSNMLDFRGITRENNEAVVVMFQDDPVAAGLIQVTNLTTHSYHQRDAYFFGVDSVIGREKEVDFIYTNCTTKYVDSRGGRSDYPDHIMISHTYKECNHDKVIQLGSDTLLLNEAVTGKFSYFVNDVYSNVKCTLKRSTPYRKLVTENNRIEHQFIVNAALTDIIKFEFHHKKDEYYDIDIRMYFKDKSGQTSWFHLDTILGYGKNNGGMDNVAIYLKDNVELRYHHNGIYALLKSNKSALDIIKKYQPIAINFGISMFIYAEKEDAIVSIGSDQKDDVLYNDPSYKTYLAGNKGNNSYIVISGRDVLQGPDPPSIPEIEIYSTESQNHINTLDLHSLTQQIKEDLGQELLMKHAFDADKLVLYLYTLKTESTAANSYNNITSITFRNIPNPPKWDYWCKTLHILLNKAPVVLKCDQDYQRKFGKVIDFDRDVKNYNPLNYYTPLPLEFSNYEVIVIREEDVEPNTQVIVKHKLGQHRFLRLEDDLILTNGFDLKTPAYRPTTVMIKNFYKVPTVFYTIKFLFDDKVMSFNSEKENIDKAKSLEDWYNEYDKISKDIIGDLPRRRRRDLGIPQDPSTRSKFEPLQSSLKGVFGNVMESLSNICYKPLEYVHGYFKNMVNPKLVHDTSQHIKFDSPYEYRIVNGRILESKPKEASSTENKVTNMDVNSTLLLLDTLVRKLNDSKYKLPTEDNLLSPEEELEKKMAALTSKLALDPNDIAGSLEGQLQRILNNITEE